MAKSLVDLQARTFMERLFQDERDFSGSRLIGGPLAIEDLKRLNTYLEHEDHEGRLENEPMIFDHSNISGLILPKLYTPDHRLVGLYAPYTKARGVIAVNIKMPGSYLNHADFGPYVYPNGTQRPSDLSYATFNESDMRYAILRGVNVTGTRFMFTNLWDADIHDIVGAGDARYLDMAILTPEQRSYLTSLIDHEKQVSTK